MVMPLPPDGGIRNRKQYEQKFRESKVKKLLVVIIACVCFGLALASRTCTRSNNMLLGRVEAEVSGHTVVVIDCYRTSVPPPQTSVDADGRSVHRFMPCRDADVMIRGAELIVNGRAYESLQEGDTVIVDHGRVLINDRAAQELRIER